LLPLLADGKNLTRPSFVKKLALVSLCAVSLLLFGIFVVVRAADRRRVIQLPTSKNLTVPVPGYIARTTAFPRPLP